MTSSRPAGRRARSATAEEDAGDDAVTGPIELPRDRPARRRAGGSADVERQRGPQADTPRADTPPADAPATRGRAPRSGPRARARARARRRLAGRGVGHAGATAPGPAARALRAGGAGGPRGARPVPVRVRPGRGTGRDRTGRARARGADPGRRRGPARRRGVRLHRPQPALPRGGRGLCRGDAAPAGRAGGREHDRHPGADHARLAALRRRRRRRARLGRRRPGGPR